MGQPGEDSGSLDPSPASTIVLISVADMPFSTSRDLRSERVFVRLDLAQALATTATIGMAITITTAIFAVVQTIPGTDPIYPKRPRGGTAAPATHPRGAR